MIVSSFSSAISLNDVTVIVASSAATSLYDAVFVSVVVVVVTLLVVELLVLAVPEV